MPYEISTAERAAYYRAALQVLRLVEAREPSGRRFGVDADALWKGFAGGLKTSDRIDLLLRDADAAWPGAFGARATFGLRAVAEDDAFGADWASLEPMDGEKLWRAALKDAAPGTTEEAMMAILAAWESRATAFEVPGWTATTKRVLGGLGAIVGSIRAFAEDKTLSWAEQVVVVADAPVERQLAASTTALLNLDKPTVLWTSDARETGARAGWVALVSDDATAEVRAAAQELARP